MLLFGVVVVAAACCSALTQQRHALQGQVGLRAFLFLVIGIYFVWFWSRTGQTLAMKTWHIRLVTAQGGPVTSRVRLCATSCAGCGCCPRSARPAGAACPAGCRWPGCWRARRRR
jgi:uncharacterized RDD family membrane protein YckC